MISVVLLKTWGAAATHWSSLSSAPSGARRGDVTAMILRKAVTLLAAGLEVGVGLSLVAGRAASALLFRLKPRDPGTLTIVVVVLAAVAVGASYLPARRAAALDPIVSLKNI